MESGGEVEGTSALLRFDQRQIIIANSLTRTIIEMTNFLAHVYSFS